MFDQDGVPVSGERAAFRILDENPEGAAGAGMTTTDASGFARGPLFEESSERMRLRSRIPLESACYF